MYIFLFSGNGFGIKELVAIYTRQIYISVHNCTIDMQ